MYINRNNFTQHIATIMDNERNINHFKQKKKQKQKTKTKPNDEGEGIKGTKKYQ